VSDHSTPAERDGQGTFVSQGARPNYKSTIVPLAYTKRPFYSHKHEQFLGAAALDLS
jgi:catalase